MIGKSDYIQQFKSFGDIDLKKSWVSFQSQSVVTNGKIYKVLIPIIGSKPNRLLRWIYKIFNILTGHHFKRETAKDLVNSIADFRKISLQVSNDDDLQKRVKKVATDLLVKFQKHKYCKGNLLLELENVFFNTNEPILVNKSTKTKFHLELDKLGLKQKALEFTSIDWKNKDNSLFDPSLTNKWIKESSKKWVKEYASKMKLPQFFEFSLDAKHEVFLDFINKLTSDQQIEDHYHKVLPQENVDRLKAMIFAIMNTIKKQDLKDFDNKYVMVVEETCKALNNCSNAMNTAIENLFYDIYFSNLSGGISQKVSMRLQKLRDGLFRECIQEILNKNTFNSEYFLKHAAATFNLYYGNNEICTALGLPISVSSFDSKYKSYALQGEELEIMKLFNQKYTSERITDVIYDAVCDVNDTSIPTALFTDWVMNHSKLNLDEVLEEDTGQYKKSCVTCLLEYLEIIKPKKN